jgi:hypothetical protein
LECSLHEHLFESREDWWQHETRSHRHEWFCNTGNHPTFQQASDFVTHMKDHHLQVIQDSQLAALQHIFHHPKLSLQGVCNLCGSSTTKLKSHIAKHLQQLALFAIPQTDYMDDSETEDAQSDKAHRSRGALEDNSFPSTTASSPVQLQDFSPPSTIPQSPVISNVGDPFSNDELDLISPAKAGGDRVLDPSPGYTSIVRTSPSDTTEANIIRSLQESIPKDAEAPEEPPPISIVVDGNEDTSWDFATPKFREARAAMYDARTLDVVKSRPISPEKVSNARNGMQNTENFNADAAVVNPYHQHRPMCGASIGAYHGQHLPPVSLGGIILVDGKPYGLTVHHMLDAPSESGSDGELDTRDESTEQGREKDEPESQAEKLPLKPSQAAEPTDEKIEVKRHKTKNNAWLLDQPSGSDSAMWDLDMSDDASGDGSDGDAESFGSRYNAFDTDDEAMEAGSEWSDTSIGDIPGIPPGQGEHIKVTQPAIDDVDEYFFPNEEDRDEDHLMAYKYGHVHASSGIRRWNRKGIVHEIDWALIEIDPDRLQPWNIVQGGQRFRLRKELNPPPIKEPVDRRRYTPEEDEYPMEVADADSLGELNVHCFGRTTGLQGGKINPKMSSVRIYHRETYSRSWTVAGGCKICPANLKFR